MGRDYVARNKRPAARPAGLPGWVWACAGLSIGLFVAAWVYISRPPQPMPMATRPTLEGAVKPRAPKVSIPAVVEPRFKFYGMLENETLVVPSPTPEAADGTPYVVVVAAFKEASNAEAQQASLALSGIETKVQKGVNEGGETLYRVVIPEKGQTRAQTVLSQLKGQGINGYIVQKK